MNRRRSERFETVSAEGPLNPIDNKENLAKTLKNDVSDGNTSDLCEYEKIRMQNIYERQKMFEQLGIDESRRENSTVKKKPNINKKKKVMDENQEPVRKSARIAGGVPEIERFTPNFDDYAADEEYVSRPRRRLALENYNDYLHATKTFTGNENPETLSEVQKERFKILQVPKKCTIKQFVLSNNLEFKVGRGFYEFTKPEIISHKKEVVLVDKETGEMFTGKDACRMIKGKPFSKYIHFNEFGLFSWIRNQNSSHNLQ